MLIDYHIHTAMSGDAKGDFADCVKFARDRGLAEIGFSDHFHLKKQSYSMSYETLAQYVEKMRAYKESIDFPVKLGLEVDFIPNREGEIEKATKLEGFDYIIGSVHFINNWGFDDPKYEAEYQKWNIDDLNRTYFSLVQQCAKSKLFNIIGHVDLIKKFGYKPKTDMTDILTETTEIFKKTKVCVEVNTGGLRAPCREIYPSRPLLKMCFNHGVPITLGSDAHTPEHVGKDFDQALALIREVGYKNIAKFTHRRLEPVNI
jgi:histidinol-phosphatase (PHP family)